MFPQCPVWDPEFKPVSWRVCQVLFCSCDVFLWCVDEMWFCNVLLWCVLWCVDEMWFCSVLMWCVLLYVEVILFVLCCVTMVHFSGNSFHPKIYVLILLSWSLVGFLLHQAGHECATILDFCIYSREIIKMFPDLGKKHLNHWLFPDTVQTSFFQTSHNYNLAWSLPIYTRFDDLDLVSRSQVCWHQKLKILL